MKTGFGPPPERERLGDLPLHAVVRDWPEVLPAFLAGAVDPATEGHTPLAELAGGRGWEERVLEATAWRGAGES